MRSSALVAVQSWISVSNIGYYSQWVLLLFWIPAFLYLLLFAPMPAVHDQLHSFRHAFGMIGCH